MSIHAGTRIPALIQHKTSKEVMPEHLARLRDELNSIRSAIRNEVDVDLLKWKVTASTIRISLMFGFL